MSIDEYEAPHKIIDNYKEISEEHDSIWEIVIEINIYEEVKICR